MNDLEIEIQTFKDVGIDVSKFTEMSELFGAINAKWDYLTEDERNNITNCFAGWSKHNGN